MARYGRINDTVALIQTRRARGEHAVGRGIANRPPRGPRFPIEPLTRSERYDRYMRQGARSITERQARRIEHKTRAGDASRRRNLKAALRG